DLTDFLPHTDQDVGKLLERLRAILMKLGNPHLRALVECFLMDDDFVRRFCQAPAGVRNHHAYVGGLLEHVVTLLDAADRLLPLKHMILSHHGTYEFGSPKLPMTPEAIALHHLDNLDAKVHSFTRDIREDRNQTSSWTPFNQSLQRRLFKGSAAGGEALYSPTLDG